MRTPKARFAQPVEGDGTFVNVEFGKEKTVDKNNSYTLENDDKFVATNGQVVPEATATPITNGSDRGVVAGDDVLLQSKHKTSYFETLIHIFKGNVGPGVLALAEAFKHGGLFLSPVLTLMIGIISVHLQHVLLQCAGMMRDKIGATEYPDYARTVELCLETGPVRYRRFSRPMRIATNWFLCVTQLGFCCVYIVFVPVNTTQILQVYGINLHEKVIMTIILIPILLSSLLTNLKYLSYCSLIAGTCMIAGCGITLYYIFLDLPSPSERNAVGTVHNLPLFFGTAIFAFEGISMVLPLQSAMKKPRDFHRPAGVLNVGMVIVTSLFLIIGFFGYLKYGEEIQSSISLNLPIEEKLAQVVKILFAIGVLLGFALQFFIAIQIMWPTVVERFQWKEGLLQKELMFRTVMVLVTYAIAISIPNLGILISLIGAFASTSLALVFPVLIELITKSDEEKGSGVSPWIWLKSVLILLLALIGCVLGTYENVANIIRIYSS